MVAAGRVERVRGVGICGSDLSLISGARRAPAYPWIPGHAATGEIVAAGPGVDGGRTGQRVVIGAGSQGALLCVALIARGITPHVLEPDEGRRRLGVSLGATATGPGDTGFGTVYETSGAEAALAEAIGRSAPGATVILIGLGNPTPRTDAGLVVRRQLTLRGSLGLTNCPPAPCRGPAIRWMRRPRRSVPRRTYRAKPG